MADDKENIIRDAQSFAKARFADDGSFSPEAVADTVRKMGVALKTDTVMKKLEAYQRAHTEASVIGLLVTSGNDIGKAKEKLNQVAQFGFDMNHDATLEDKDGKFKLTDEQKKTVRAAIEAEKDLRRAVAAAIKDEPRKPKDDGTVNVDYMIDEYAKKTSYRPMLMRLLKMEEDKERQKKRQDSASLAAPPADILALGELHPTPIRDTAIAASMQMI